MNELRLLLVIAVIASVFVGCGGETAPTPTLIPSPEPTLPPLLPPPAAGVGDFTYSDTITITNNTGSNLTNPAIKVPIIPYSGIEFGEWEITLADSSTETYNFRIPIDVNNVSNQTVTDYETKVGPMPTDWLVTNSWASSSGNETIFTTSDGSTLMNFWTEESPHGWNDDDTYFWVEGTISAETSTTWYMYCDPDVSVSAAVGTTQYTNTIFDMYDTMDSLDTDIWDETGSVSFSGGVATISGAVNNWEKLTSDNTYGPNVAIRMYAKNSAYDATASSGTFYGFRKDDNPNYYMAYYEHMQGGDQSILVRNGGAGTVDRQINQYPHPIATYAVWEVMLRDDSNGDEYNSWARFEVNNIICTEAPRWGANVPDIALNAVLWSYDAKALYVDWVMVRDYISPEPIVRIPQIEHDPDTVFLQDNCEHWPYDLAITKDGNSTELYHFVDDTTLVSEYATKMYFKYDGTINNGATADCTLYWGNAAQSSASSYHDAEQVFDWYNAGDTVGWTTDGGSWSNSTQQREIYVQQKDIPNSVIYTRNANPYEMSDGKMAFIALEASWAGVDSNSQGNPQWMDPWDYGMAVETNWPYFKYEDSVHKIETDDTSSWGASTYPANIWWGTGSNGFTDDTLYMMSTSAYRNSGDGAAWLSTSTDDGYNWYLANGHSPIATLSDVQTHVDGDATYCFFGDLEHKSISGTDYYFLFGSGDGGSTGLFYLWGNATYTSWSGGSWIVIEDDDGQANDGLEDSDVELVGSTWYVSFEDYVPTDTVELHYATCADADFDTSMAQGDWSNSGTISGIADDAWDNQQSIFRTMLTGSEYRGLYTGISPTNTRTTDNTLGWANSSDFATWVEQYEDSEYKQATIDSSWQRSYTGGNYSSFEIIAELASGPSHATNDLVCVTWREDTANDYFYFLQFDYNDSEINYGHKDSGGVTYATALTTEELWDGQRYRVRIRSDSSGTTDIAWSKYGWEWEDLWTDVDLSKGGAGDAASDELETYGDCGVATYSSIAYFDNFRVEEWVGDSCSIAAQGEVDVQTDAATNIDTTTVTLNGQITGGPGASTIGFIWATTPQNPTGSPTDYANNWTENTNAPYGIDSYTHDLTGLSPRTTYYFYFAAQADTYPNTWYWDDGDDNFTTLSSLRCNMPVGPSGYIY